MKKQYPRFYPHVMLKYKKDYYDMYERPIWGVPISLGNT